MIAKILGHSTPTTTINIYAHVADDSAEEAMAMLDSLLEGPKAASMAAFEPLPAAISGLAVR